MGRNSSIPAMIIFVCGLLGIMICFIEQLAYTNSWILNQYITDSSMLTGLQILTMVVFLIGGGIIAALSS
jgi:hypothetical protein